MALKSYNPVTPSQRQLVLVDRAVLYKGKPVKALTEGKHSSGGRNNNGRTTVRFRGGGHKQTYRVVDFKRRKFDVAAKPTSSRRSASGSATRWWRASMST
jgi:large subunit ribosomal protein L2